MSITTVVLVVIAVWGPVVAYLWGWANGHARYRREEAWLSRMEDADLRDAPRDPNAPASVIHIAEVRRDRPEMHG